jgi:D-beta-D-heptose 7-phosphate kinase / D-beta-D-heptose 1-phosphate adenosyltransferase
MNPRLADPVSALGGLRVLVVGDAMLDTYVLGTTTRLCQQAPVPIVDASSREHAAGGAGNVAANVAALGGQARLVALTGTDPAAGRLRSCLDAAGIDIASLLADDDRETLEKTRVVSDGQLLARVDHGSTGEAPSRQAFAIAGAVRDAWTSSDAVIIADYGYGVLSAHVIETIAALQRAMPRPFVVDAKDLRRYRGVGATAAKPNFEQALALMGTRADGDRAEFLTARADRLLRATGTQIVASTLDHEGALAIERDRSPYRTYARPSRAATTSGAGDTFAAALTLAIAAGNGMPQAVEIASAASAVVVEKERTSCCSAAELRFRLSGGDKIVMDSADAATRADFHRRRGERIVLTNGCFDLLHRGHVTYLSRAKQLGDLLVVGVNSDESVRALKGPSRPVNALDDRLEVLAALSCVDLVVGFDDRTPERLIDRIRPDVFVKGGDYTVQMLPEAPLVERLGGTVLILPYVEDRSTTAILERIRADAARVTGARTVIEANVVRTPRRQNS